MRHTGDPAAYPLAGGVGALAETYNPGRHAFRAWWSWGAISHGDFDPILNAARELRADPDARIYRPGELSEERAAFVYAPFSALLLWPFAAAEQDPEAVADGASVVGHVLALAGLVLLFGVAFPGVRPGAFATGAFVVHAALFYPLAMALHLTQAGVWIFACLALATWLTTRGYSLAGGLALAVGVSIKPHLVLVPCLLAVVPGFPRRLLVGCAAGIAATTAASLAFAGWTNCVEYVTEALPTLSAGYAYFRNQSFNGMLLRVFTEQDPAVFDLAEPVPLLKAAASALGLTLLVVTALASRRAASRGASPAVLLGIAIAAVVLASPVCWFHHLLLLAPPLAVGVASLRARGASPTTPVAVLLLLGGVLAGSFFDGGGLDNGVASLASGFAFYGGLLVLFALVRIALQPQEVRP